MAAYRGLVQAATLLTFIVVVLGAYVRLADAGLGCPDWPGCYGKLTPIQAKEEIAAAVAAQGGTHGPVSMPKAWKEMVHRYLAGVLGLLIAAIAAIAWVRRRALGQSPWLPLALVGVVGLQATLGMWTVTLLLKPVIVTLHLLGGMTVLGLLAWLTLRQYAFAAPAPAQSRLAGFAAAGFALLLVQIALGGWVSTNYAALACTDLPTCRGAWVPEMDLANAFHLFRELGREADGDLLSLDALVAIHWLHRVFAVIVAVVLFALAARLYAAGARRLGIVLAAALAGQLTLGVLNVALSLPLPVAAAHNAGAAAILVTMVVINFTLRRRSASAAPSPLPVPAA